MAELERLSVGDFSLAHTVPLEDMGDMSDEERLSYLLPIESLFDGLPAVGLPAFYERLCRSGCEIYQKKIGTEHKIGTRVRICDASGRFFALGEIREYEEGTAIKAIKQFDI